MATHDTAPWIGRMRVLRKNPEPRPGMPGARILPLKGVGKRNAAAALGLVLQPPCPCTRQLLAQDRKSTRLNSSHVAISYAVFCLKKKINPRSQLDVGHAGGDEVRRTPRP